MEQLETHIYASDLTYPCNATVVETKPQAKKCLIHQLFGRIPARLVLYWLSWSGFLVSFMMRSDINLTIIAMVEEPLVSALSSLSNGTAIVADEYCYDQIGYNDTNSSSSSSISMPNYGGTLKWSDRVQSYVLSSFYWAYILSQVIGGYATQRLGTKRVFGYAQLVTALCSLCIPAAARTTHWLVIGLRCVQGFASGLTWPAMYALVGDWIPLPERSRFMSSFQGFSIGIGVTYPLCGYLIANFGWPSVFYTTGLVGCAWCVLWYLLAFDSPETHPRISLREQQYIRVHTTRRHPAEGLKERRTTTVPWRAILSSLPAWAIGITTFGRIWVHYTFIIPGPKFMKNILGFSIEKNGLLSGAPFLCSYLASVVFCYIADKLVTGHWMTLGAVRKLMTALSQVVPGILVLLLGHIGCDVTLVLLVWFPAVTLITAAYAGAMANVVDIAPNLAGPVLAFAQTIHMTASFLSPLVAFHILNDQEHLIASWRHVFYVTGAVAILTYTVYQLWGTAQIQPWNYSNYTTENNNTYSPKSSDDQEDLVTTVATMVAPPPPLITPSDKSRTTNCVHRPIDSNGI